MTSNFTSSEMLKESILKITSFNYVTGDIEEDINYFWKQIFKDKILDKDISKIFQTKLKNYSMMYYGLKGVLPNSQNTSIVFLKDFVFYKTIINMDKENDFTIKTLEKKLSQTYDNTNLDIWYKKELNFYKKNFSNLQDLANNLTLLEKYIDDILNIITNYLKLDLKKMFSVIDKTLKTKNFLTDDIEIKSMKNTISKLKEQVSYLEKVNSEMTKTLIDQNNLDAKKFISSLDDEDLDFPLSNLYLLSKNINSFEDLKKVKGFLTNFFLALERNEIRQIDISKLNKKIIVKEEEVLLNYRILGTLNNHSNKGYYILPGWEYNNQKILLPLVKVEEEQNNEQK